jgi:hypothetical protein
MLASNVPKAVEKAELAERRYEQRFSPSQTVGPTAGLLGQRMIWHGRALDCSRYRLELPMDN